MDPLSLIVYAFPAYLANSAPVLFGGGAPVDFGALWLDGRRVFGKSKTLTGLVSGIAAGSACGLVLAGIFPSLFLPQFSFQEKVFVAFLLACGTMAGDLAGSFIKRRLNLAPGEPFFITDQLLFLVFALAFASVVFLPPVSDIILLFLVTFFLHISFNIIAHRLNLKRVPW